MKIRCCENSQVSRKLFKKLKEKYSDPDTRRKACLKCDPCHKTPFPFN